MQNSYPQPLELLEPLNPAAEMWGEGGGGGFQKFEYPFFLRVPKVRAYAISGYMRGISILGKKGRLKPLVRRPT